MASVSGDSRTGGSRLQRNIRLVFAGRLPGARADDVPAIDAKAKAGLRKSSGLPAPDTKVTIAKLAEEVRETKRAANRAHDGERREPGERRKLADSSLEAFEYALDNIILPELGLLKPGACGPDRCARLIRDLEDGKVTGRKLGPSTIRRYLNPLAAIFKLAIRRGIVHASPLTLFGDDERPTGGGVRDHYEWSATEISDVIAASERVATRR